MWNLTKTTSMHPDAPVKLTPFNVIAELQHLPLDALRELAAERQLPFAIALANVTGDLNTGVMIRTACCLGASRVFIFGKRKYDRRSTVGAHHYIDVAHFEATDESDVFDWRTSLQILRSNGYTPVLIEQGGQPIYDLHVTEIPPQVCLVFGAEERGIPADVCAEELCFTIPQSGILRSLNVSSAAAIAMWHVSAQCSQGSL